MFTYISIEEFADGVVKNNKDANRRELIASLREALAAKKNGARCMICGAPIWAAGSGVTGTYLCFTCTTGEADDSEDYSAAKNSGVSRSLRQPSSSRRVSIRFLWASSCHMVPGKLSASRMILAVRRGRYGNSSATASA